MIIFVIIEWLVIIVVAVGIICGIFGTEHESLPKCEVCKEVDVHLCPLVIVLAQESFCNRIHIMCAEIISFLCSPCSVRITYRRIGKLLDCRADDISVVNGVALHGFCHGSPQSSRQPFGDFVVDVNTCGKAFEVGTDGDSFLFQVTARYGVLHIVVSSRNVYLMVMHRSILKNFILPVCPLAQQGKILEFGTFPKSDDCRAHIVIFGIFA